MILSEVATRGEGEERKVMTIADVKKAFYEAKTKRELCMELPKEDMTEEDMEEDMVGFLELAMPGTRDAGMHGKRRWLGG